MELAVRSYRAPTDHEEGLYEATAVLRKSDHHVVAEHPTIAAVWRIIGWLQINVWSIVEAERAAGRM
jgi:hypothetical protein